MQPAWARGASQRIAQEARSFSTHPRDRTPLTPSRRARLEFYEDEMTEKLRSVLESRVERVAVVSRAGSDLSRFRFRGEIPRFTHSAFAIREPAGWRLRHVLNTHAGPEGHLYVQDLEAFARDDPWEYRFEVLVPTAAIQYGLARALTTRLPTHLHETRYSAIAFPGSLRYQQSNQWLLEVMAALQQPGTRPSRPAAQAFLRSRGLRPSVIEKRALAGFVGQWAYRLRARNARFDDHPMGARARGHFAFVSSTTVRDFLADNDWLADRIELCSSCPETSGRATDSSSKQGQSSRSMAMSSEPRGIGTSTVEITNITTHGVWLLAGERELLMPYSHFPFFRDVSVARILNVEEATRGHFYWPDLDVDLGIETIEDPDRFPLIAKHEE